MAQRIVIVSRTPGEDWTQEGHNVTDGGRLVWSHYWPTTAAAKEHMDRLSLPQGGQARVLVRDDSHAGGERIVHERKARDGKRES